MKKTIITVFAFLVVFGFTITGAMAQTWTWDDPLPITPLPTGGKFIELSAGPKSATIYGLDVSGAVSAVSTGTAVSSTDAPEMVLESAIDFVVGFGGIVYVIDENTVGYLNESNFATLEQPKLPAGQTGTFISIAAGNNGNLYVLFEVNDTEQYLLKGNPPITEGLVVKLNPQSLNLGSKGKWVTCQLQLPEGENITDLDTSSIEITQFKVGEDVYDVSIPVDNNAPVGTATDKRIIKFIRYDKTDPANLASMVGALSDIFTEQSKGKIDVTATVKASLINGETFSGEATFQVIVPKAKKQK